MNQIHTIRLFLGTIAQKFDDERLGSDAKIQQFASLEQRIDAFIAALPAHESFGSTLKGEWRDLTQIVRTLGADAEGWHAVARRLANMAKRLSVLDKPHSLPPTEEPPKETSFFREEKYAHLLKEGLASDIRKTQKRYAGLFTAAERLVGRILDGVYGTEVKEQLLDGSVQLLVREPLLYYIIIDTLLSGGGLASLQIGLEEEVPPDAPTYSPEGELVLPAYEHFAPLIARAKIATAKEVRHLIEYMKSGYSPGVIQLLNLAIGCDEQDVMGRIEASIDPRLFLQFSDLYFVACAATDKELMGQVKQFLEIYAASESPESLAALGRGLIEVLVKKKERFGIAIRLAYRYLPDEAYRLVVRIISIATRQDDALPLRLIRAAPRGERDRLIPAVTTRIAKLHPRTALLLTQECDDSQAYRQALQNICSAHDDPESLVRHTHDPMRDIFCASLIALAEENHVGDLYRRLLYWVYGQDQEWILEVVMQRSSVWGVLGHRPLLSCCDSMFHDSIYFGSIAGSLRRHFSVAESAKWLGILRTITNPELCNKAILWICRNAYDRSDRRFFQACFQALPDYLALVTPSSESTYTLLIAVVAALLLRGDASHHAITDIVNRLTIEAVREALLARVVPLYFGGAKRVESIRLAALIQDRRQLGRALIEAVAQVSERFTIYRSHVDALLTFTDRLEEDDRDSLITSLVRHIRAYDPLKALDAVLTIRDPNLQSRILYLVYRACYMLEQVNEVHVQRMLAALFRWHDAEKEEFLDMWAALSPEYVPHFFSHPCAERHTVPVVFFCNAFYYFANREVLSEALKEQFILYARRYTTKEQLFLCTWLGPHFARCSEEEAVRFADIFQEKEMRRFALTHLGSIVRIVKKAFSDTKLPENEGELADMLISLTPLPEAIKVTARIKERTCFIYTLRRMVDALTRTKLLPLYIPFIVNALDNRSTGERHAIIVTVINGLAEARDYRRLLELASTIENQAITTHVVCLLSRDVAHWEELFGVAGPILAYLEQHKPLAHARFLSRILQRTEPVYAIALAKSARDHSRYLKQIFQDLKQHDQELAWELLDSLTHAEDKEMCAEILLRNY